MEGALCSGCGRGERERAGVLSSDAEQRQRHAFAGDQILVHATPTRIRAEPSSKYLDRPRKY